MEILRSRCDARILVNFNYIPSLDALFHEDAFPNLGNASPCFLALRGRGDVSPRPQKRKRDETRRGGISKKNRGEIIKQSQNYDLHLLVAPSTHMVLG